MADQTFGNQKVYKDFDLSFDANPMTGDISTKSDVQAINQSLKNLVNISYYERPFQPALGCRLRSLLFEPADPIVVMEIKSSVEEAILNHEPRIKLISVNVQDRSDVNAYVVSITYRINITTDVQQLKYTLKRLR